MRQRGDEQRARRQRGTQERSVRGAENLKYDFARLARTVQLDQENALPGA
jgi:hypothetical protein